LTNHDAGLISYASQSGVKPLICCGCWPSSRLRLLLLLLRTGGTSVADCKQILGGQSRISSHCSVDTAAWWLIAVVGKNVYYGAPTMERTSERTCGDINRLLARELETESRVSAQSELVLQKRQIKARKTLRTRLGKSSRILPGDRGKRVRITMITFCSPPFAAPIGHARGPLDCWRTSAQGYFPSIIRQRWSISGRNWRRDTFKNP